MNEFLRNYLKCRFRCYDIEKSVILSIQISVEQGNHKERVDENSKGKNIMSCFKLIKVIQ